MDIVNERFKYKEVAIHRDDGFRVRSESGEAIALEDLSSGEQHELVLLYELLFRAPRNGSVLVDEPEISLHVSWQTRFLSDLSGILELTDSYAVVATHSPVIIGNRMGFGSRTNGPWRGREIRVAMRAYIDLAVLTNLVTMLRADVDGAIWLADDDAEARFYERCGHPVSRVVSSPGIALAF